MRLRIPKQRLKFALAALFTAAVGLFGNFSNPSQAFSGGPPNARTGAAALGVVAAELACNACHASFPLNSGPGVVTLSGLPVSYTPGQEIPITVTVTQADRGRYGFEATVLDDQGRKAGDLVVTDATRTRLVDGTGNYAGRQYIQHILAGVAPTGTNQGSWTFTWRAPAQSVGRVTFFVAGNAANNNGGNSGDYIYTTSQTVQPTGSLALASAASFAPTGNAATEAILAVFGANLANGTATATTLPLPTTLAEATVRVRDAAGSDRNAPLFFAGPSQINFLLPEGTSNGVATITVLRGNTTAGTVTVLVENVAPTLFTASASGQGLPAAVAVRIKADGSQTFEPVVQFNATTNSFEAVPLDLGAATDQVVLVLFGSGLRRNAGTNNRAQIGGTDAPVQFVGAQGSLAGLDQANLLVPRSLAGRGNVELALTVDNRRTNLVTINIK